MRVGKGRAVAVALLALLVTALVASNLVQTSAPTPDLPPVGPARGDAAVRAKATLVVRVVDEALTPVSAVGLDIDACDGGELLGTMSTDERGSARWVGMTAGCYRIEPVDPWQSAADRTVEIDGDDVSVQLEVYRACAGGYRVVAADGAPLSEVELSGDDVDPRDPPITDHRGRAEVPARRCGVRELFVEPPGEPRARVLATVTRTDTVVDLVVADMRFADLRFVRHGEPVAVSPPPSARQGWEQREIGVYRVTARATAATVQTRTMDTGDPVHVTVPLDGGRYTIALAAEGRLVRVEATCDPEGCPPEMRADGRLCEGGGPYTCHCAGECSLSVERSRGLAAGGWGEVGRVPDGVEVHAVDLREASPGAVRAVWAGAPPCTARLDGPLSGLAVPCDRGRWLNVENLPPGEWRLLLENPGLEAAVFELSLNAGDSVDLGLVEPEPDAVRGRVAFTGSVGRYSLRVDPLGSVESSTDGTVVVRGLPVGQEIEVTAFADGSVWTQRTALAQDFVWTFDTLSPAGLSGVASVQAEVGER